MENTVNRANRANIESFSAIAQSDPGSWNSCRPRKMSAVVFFVSIFSLTYCLTYCLTCTRAYSDTKPPGNSSGSQVLIVSSIPPIASMVEHLTLGQYGNQQGSALPIRSESLIRAGTAPENFTPIPSQLARLSQAKLLLHFGFPLVTNLLSKLDSKGLTQVNLAEAIDWSIGRKKHTIQTNSKTNPQTTFHGHDHDHDHSMGNPHVWTCPKNLIKIADRVAQILIGNQEVIRVINAKQIMANLLIYRRKIKGIDNQVRTILTHAKKRAFLVFHPAWECFAREYQLEEIAFEVDGKSPGQKHLAELVRLAENKSVKSVFMQPQFKASLMQVLAKKIGAEITEVNPLAPNIELEFLKIAKTIASNQ